MTTKLKLVTFPASDEFIEAINEAVAENEGKSRAEYLREIIAEAIAYDLANEPKVGRPRKYADREASKAAARARARAKRQLINDILLAVERGNRQEDIAALMRSLQTSEDNN